VTSRVPSFNLSKLACTLATLGPAVPLVIAEAHPPSFYRLLQFVQESQDYKQESQKGRHGVLYHLMQDFNRVSRAELRRKPSVTQIMQGPFEAMMKSVHNLQQTLLKAEQAEA